MGSLRIQETYRIDPNDLRNLPAGVAWITTAGRAAKVCVTRGGQAPITTYPRRGRRSDERVGRGDPALGRASVVVDGQDEIAFVEARLVPANEPNEALPTMESRLRTSWGTGPTVEQQTLPIDEPVQAQPEAPTEDNDETLEEFAGPFEAPPRRVSPYAEGL
jgi:hypothetical protein